jgi:hypothetical protein
VLDVGAGPAAAAGAGAAVGFDGAAAIGFDGAAAIGFDGAAAIGFDGAAAIGFDGAAAIGFDGAATCGFDAAACGAGPCSLVAGPNVGSESISRTASSHAISGPFTVRTSWRFAARRSSLMRALSLRLVSRFRFANVGRTLDIY